MLVTVDSRNPMDAKVDLLALPMVQIDPEKWRLPPRLGAVDRALGGGLSAVLKSGDFKAKSGDSFLLYPDGGVAAKRLLLVGLGEEATLDADSFRRAGGTAVSQASCRRAKSVGIAVPRSRRLKVPVIWLSSPSKAYMA